MLLYKYVASRIFQSKSVMPRVTPNLLVIKHPTNLFPQHVSSPGNVFVHATSSVGNLKFLEERIGPIFKDQERKKKSRNVGKKIPLLAA